MLRVNGFYGHVRLNDLRSLAMFAGFVVAFQIVAAVALLPPLLLLDVGHSLIFPSKYAARYAPVVLIFGVVFFVVRFLRHVTSVESSVAFAYVDRRTHPRLVNIVETLSIAAGLPAPKVGLIETQARNAFACGLSASSAVVVVTRGLLESLDDDELAAVVAHEIAHIKNGDIRLMAAANVLMENLEWVRKKSLARRVGWKTALVLVIMPALAFLFALSGFFNRIAFTIARASRLLISSSREFVADAEAVRLTHNPAALISALRRVEGRSAVAGLSAQADAMMIDGAVEGPLATHPTISERITVLARLAGSWAEADGPRKDTRPMPERADRAAGPWGSVPAVPAPAPASAPARLLIQRVNAGIKENMFELPSTPTAKYMLKFGPAIIFGLPILAVFLSDGPARPNAKVTAERAIAEKAGAEVRRLSALDPREGRCFATGPYTVGDRGKRQVRTPDRKLVEAYASGERNGSSDVVLERYLGWKEQSVRNVASAGSAELDAELLRYVTTRKIVLEVVHRFFAEPGLRLIQEAYDTRDDRAILARLQRRLGERAPALVADGRVAAEIALLVSAPESFIPCVARASLN